jgi:hypothetical protein
MNYSMFTECGGGGSKEQEWCSPPGGRRFWFQKMINGVVDSWMHILDYPTETGSTHTTVHIGTYRMYPYAFNLELPVLVLWLHFYRSTVV